MQARRFSTWLRQLEGLTVRQRIQLVHALQPAFYLDRVCEVIDGPAGLTPPCPACASESAYRHGRVRGLQRYRCRACARTFTALTGTPLARLRYRSKSARRTARSQ